MDESERELLEVSGSGAAAGLSSNDLVYIRDESASDNVVHRVDITWGTGNLGDRKYTTHCRLHIPVRETLWTKDKPTCVVCIGVGDPEP